MAGFIKIGNAKIPLSMTVIAMSNIEEKTGKAISELDQWLSDEKDSTSQMLKKFSTLICILANGEIAKQNSAIALGLTGGTKKDFFKDEDFWNLLALDDLRELRNGLLSTMSSDMDFEVPDNVKLAEKDADLEEIERLKAEKAGN